MFYLLPPDLPSKFLSPTLYLRMLSFMSCINRPTPLASNGIGQWARLIVTGLGFLPVCSLQVSWDPLLPFLVVADGGWFFLTSWEDLPLWLQVCFLPLCPSPKPLLYGTLSSQGNWREWGSVPLHARCLMLGLEEHTSLLLWCNDICFVIFIHEWEIFFSSPLPQSSYDSCCFKTQLALFKVCGYLIDKHCRHPLSLRAFKTNSGEQKKNKKTETPGSPIRLGVRIWVSNEEWIETQAPLISECYTNLEPAGFRLNLPSMKGWRFPCEHMGVSVTT